MEIYCPSSRGHARELAARMTALAGERPVWVADPRRIRSSAARLLYIAELKQAEALAEALEGFAGRVIVQAQHALPHKLTESRKRAILAVYSCADRILVPHGKAAHALAALGVERDRILILQGYPYRRSTVSLPRAQKSGALLAVGYHSKASGMDRLIELARLGRFRGGMPMLVAGTMDERDARALRRNGCRVIRGFLSEREMARLLASSGCLLMPYRKQAESPLVNRAIEAGVPVLRTPGVRDWNASANAPGLCLPWHSGRWLEAAQRLAQSAMAREFRMKQTASRRRLRGQLVEILGSGPGRGPASRSQGAIS